MKNTLQILAILSVFILNAQKEILVTRGEVMNRVMEENSTLKIAQKGIMAAEGDYRQTNAVLLPNISVSHTGMATNNPLMAFGVKLNQQIVTQSDFNPDLLNNPRQIEDYATRFEIQQPLLNFDGFYQRKAAKAKLYASQYQSERTRDYLTMEVEKAYMQLQLAYKTVEVLEKAKETAMENKRLADNSFKQGYLQRSDVLAVEVRATEIDNQLQYAKSNIQNASNYLSVMINDSTYQILTPADTLQVFADNFSLKKVSENRKDILAMESAKEAYYQMYRSDKMSFLPKLNAFGTYELHDEQVFRGGASGYLFGAELRWDVLNGTKRFGKTHKSKAEFEKAKLELEQYKSESHVELNKARRMLQDTKNNLELTTLALNQSKEAYRIRSNRFAQGLEKTTDLLLAETQYARKQLEYYFTIFQHNSAIAYIEFLTKE